MFGQSVTSLLPKSPYNSYTLVTARNHNKSLLTSKPGCFVCKGLHEEGGLGSHLVVLA